MDGIVIPPSGSSFNAASPGPIGGTTPNTVNATMFFAGNGAIGSPSYSWINETGSGWYRAGAGDFRFATSNNDRVRINSSGFESINGVFGSFTGNGLSLRPNGASNSTAALTIDTSGTASIVSVMVTGAGGGAMLTSDTANLLELRNGTSSQALRIYNTYTSAANFEAGNINWSSNVFTIGTSQSGAGANRGISLRVAAADRITISAAGAVAIPGSFTISQVSDSGKNFAAAGATGARTANAMSGSVRFAASALSVVLTNSQIVATSILHLGMKGNDSSARDPRYTCAAGSATIYLASAPAAELEITFMVSN